MAESSPNKRLREYGVRIGVLPTGPRNAITDVAGVRVGHATLNQGDFVRTGVTAVVPHGGNVFQSKVAGAVYAGNGFGKLAGVTQVEELGTIETPVVLTNTLAVAAGIEALVEYTLAQPGNESVRSVNGVVGETNDGQLNDIRSRPVRPRDVLDALGAAKGGDVAEGCVGAGTGTVCFGFKGGIGTASRKLPASLGGYTVGVLAQTNFGGVLMIDGVPVGRELGGYPYEREVREAEPSADGSCILVVATDAPLEARDLRRLAKRAFLGLARTGGYASNGSGDYAIAFSTAESVRVAHQPGKPLLERTVLHDDFVSPLFLAAVEGAEEAIVNSLFAARTTAGRGGKSVPALPVERVLGILRRYGRVQ